MNILCVMQVLNFEFCVSCLLCRQVCLVFPTSFNFLQDAPICLFQCTPLLFYSNNYPFYTIYVQTLSCYRGSFSRLFLGICFMVFAPSWTYRASSCVMHFHVCQCRLFAEIPNCIQSILIVDNSSSSHLLFC